MLRIDIHQHGMARTSAWASPGQPFLHLLFEAGIGRGRELCAGAGLCGKCRIRFQNAAPEPCADDRARLNESELANGWRLACKHVATQSCAIDVPVVERTSWTSAQGEGLAVDIGTTRIKWALSSKAGRSLEFAMVNPQMGVGSEVMSRLRYALSSDAARESLRQAVVSVLSDLMRDSRASALAVSGNTTMIATLLDVPLHGLAHAPYSLPWRGGDFARIGEGLPPAYIPPLLGPFIGADVSAGLAWISTRAPAYPFLLADLGTNAEFALAVDERHFHACSVPMGPAIEGVGLCCGATAGARVLSGVELEPKGLRWSGTPLAGISGTGYIAALSVLRRLGLIDTAGHFQAPSMPLARNVAERVREHRLGRVFEFEPDVFIAERDIEEFLKAKAGVNVALRSLVQSAGLTEQDVQKVYVAGALGEHAQPDQLITLGFLPESWREKTVVVGNTSLAGTLLALERADIRDWLDRLPERVVVESLVEKKDFGAKFMQSMRFAWV
ncbi:MAG: ASKHA domain-containing protein [Desulfomicrobium sp.]